MLLIFTGDLGRDHVGGFGECVGMNPAARDTKLWHCSLALALNQFQLQPCSVH